MSQLTQGLNYRLACDHPDYLGHEYMWRPQWWHNEICSVTLEQTDSSLFIYCIIICEEFLICNIFLKQSISSSLINETSFTNWHISVRCCLRTVVCGSFSMQSSQSCFHCDWGYTLTQSLVFHVNLTQKHKSISFMRSSSLTIASEPKHHTQEMSPRFIQPYLLGFGWALCLNCSFHAEWNVLFMPSITKKR